MHVSKEAQGGPRPFRFHQVWGKHEDFMPLASRTYKEAIYSSSPMDKVMKKLLLLKAALRTWNKEVFENVNRRLADSLEHLRGVHDISMND